MATETSNSTGTAAAAEEPVRIMKYNYSRLLRANLVDLSENLGDVSQIIVQMCSKDLISLGEAEQIEGNTGPIAQAKALIMILIRKCKTDEFFNQILEIFKVTGNESMIDLLLDQLDAFVLTEQDRIKLAKMENESENSDQENVAKGLLAKGGPSDNTTALGIVAVVALASDNDKEHGSDCGSRVADTGRDSVEVEQPLLSEPGGGSSGGRDSAPETPDHNSGANNDHSKADDPEPSCFASYCGWCSLCPWYLCFPDPV